MRDEFKEMESLARMNGAYLNAEGILERLVNQADEKQLEQDVSSNYRPTGKTLKLDGDISTKMLRLIFDFDVPYDLQKKLNEANEKIASEGKDEADG